MATLPQKPQSGDGSSSTTDRRSSSTGGADTAVDPRVLIAGGIRASGLLAVLQDRLQQDFETWLPCKDACDVAADIIEFLVGQLDSNQFPHHR